MCVCACVHASVWSPQKNSGWGDTEGWRLGSVVSPGFNYDTPNRVTLDKFYNPFGL